MPKIYKRLFIDEYKKKNKYSWKEECDAHFEKVKKSDSSYSVIWSEFPVVIKEAVIRVDEYSNLILKKLYKFYKENENKKLKYLEIIDLLNTKFKSFNFIFIAKNYQDRDEEDSGINYMETGLKKNNTIDILIYCNPILKNLLLDNFLNFKRKFQILMKHELIHRGQLLKIIDDELRLKVATDENESKEYLSLKKEIMAYSNSIIEELRFGGFEDNQILEIVKYNKDGISSILDTYIEQFKDTNIYVLYRLYKYIYEYLKG
jgi:hypothetical protein